MATTLRAGDKAPEFSGINEKGETVSLADYRGKKLILFFYPADNTPSCTLEACNLRDNYDSLKKTGFALLGVSPDSETKHQNFIRKFKLPFPLLADTTQETMKAYGVWGPKKFMGRSYIGVHRTTFIIDENGIIEAIIEKVKTRNHTKQILDVLAVGGV